MASRKTLLAAAAMALVATAALLPAAASKKTFTVGDDSGWDVGVDYEAWASGKEFKVGDTLVFRYKKGQNVVLVDEQNFDDCSTPDNAQPLASGNEVRVVLGQAPSGEFFFICDAKGATPQLTGLPPSPCVLSSVGHAPATARVVVREGFGYMGGWAFIPQHFQYQLIYK